MRLLICLCLISTNFCLEDISNLKLVQAYFRHGSRTPGVVEVYPNYPYEKEIEDIGYRQLTLEGKKMMYDLGKLLKNRYSNFLKTNNANDIVLAKTTNTDRTKTSLLLVLAGLFPPQESDVFEPDLQWTPIPYQYERFEEDMEFSFSRQICPNYNKEYQRVKNSELARQEVLAYEETFSYIQNKTGKNMKEILDVFLLYQGFAAIMSMNLSVPEWFTSIYPDPIKNITFYQFDLENSNTYLQRLNGGRSVKKITENMLDYYNNPNRSSNKKIYLNSVHDNNIVAILSVFNYLDHLPRYGSTIVFELHNSLADGYTVKMFYIKTPYSEPEERPILDCGAICSLERFINITKPFNPLDIHKECN